MLGCSYTTVLNIDTEDGMYTSSISSYSQLDTVYIHSIATLTGTYCIKSGQLEDIKHTHRA